VRYHAEPLTRGRAAHSLVRIVQLAYQLVTRPDAVDSVDVRAALAALQISAGESASCWPTARCRCVSRRCDSGWRMRWCRRVAQDLIGLPACMPRKPRNRRCTAISAMQGERAGVFAVADALRALFGIERACLFAPAADACCDRWPDPGGSTWRAGDPLDDGHSALPRALARNAPSNFERGEVDAALVTSRSPVCLAYQLLCQPLTLNDGRVGVLVCGDAAAV